MMKKQLEKTFMSATTDSEMSIKYDMENKPGISNLINIYSVLKDVSVKEVEKEFENSNYGEFKKKVADVVVSELLNIKEKYNEIINSKYLDEILEEGAKIARAKAKEKFMLMKKKMGLYK